MEHASRNNGFGFIFKRRLGRDATFVNIAMFLFAIGICTVAYYSDGELTDFNAIDEKHGLPGIDIIGYFAVLISALTTGEFLRKFTSFVEECHHINGRYNGSYKRALLACVGNERGQKPQLVAFLTSSIISIFYWKNLESPKITICMYVCIIALSAFGMPLLGSTYLSKVERSELNETRNINVADGLAWSFYFGYLVFVLQEFKENIERSAGEAFKVGNEYMRDIISSTKLFIIISKSCNGYKDFTEIDYENGDRIERINNLHAIRKTRGGVLNRIYKNTLYKVTHKGKPVYVAMEYATPLLSMYDMKEPKNQQNTNFYEEDLNEQVVEFYLKLTEILEIDDQCRGKYQIILCDDIGSKLPAIIHKSLDDPTIDMA